VSHEPSRSDKVVDDSNPLGGAHPQAMDVR
jgi:hypothetical protein